MPNLLKPVPPEPQPVEVTVAHPVPVRPSTAQVISAAVQNCVVAAILGYAWVIGKLDTTVAVVSLLLLVGIDFAGRKRLGSSTTAAVTLGATSVWHVLGGTGMVATILGALLLGGCATEPLPAVGNALTVVRDSYSRVDAIFVALCEPEPVAPQAAPACVDAAADLDKAREAVNTAIEAYTTVNDFAKAAEE